MKELEVGGRHYTVYTTKGIVNESGKNMETRVHGGGGGGYSYQGTGGSAPVSITSTTVVHDQIFLTDATGTEHSFQLQNFNVACREGNSISVVWAIKQGKKTGPYIVVVNHTTRQSYYNEKALKNVFRYNLWYFLGGGAAVGFVLGRGITGAIFGALFGLLAWALVCDKKKLNHFKEQIAIDTALD